MPIQMGRHHHHHPFRDRRAIRHPDDCWMDGWIGKTLWSGEWNGRKYKSFVLPRTHFHLSSQKLWISNHFSVSSPGSALAIQTVADGRQLQEISNIPTTDHHTATFSAPPTHSSFIYIFYPPSIHGPSIHPSPAEHPSVYPSTIHRGKNKALLLDWPRWMTMMMMMRRWGRHQQTKRITQTGKHPANGRNWIFRRWNEIKTWKSGIHIIIRGASQPTDRRWRAMWGVGGSDGLKLKNAGRNDGS